MNWSKTEKAVARRAFEKAYRKECDTLAAKVRQRIASAQEPEQLWEIHDYLARQRIETDRKYDYRYSVLIFVFARLIGEGRLDWADLEELGSDKLEKLKLLTNLGSE